MIFLSMAMTCSLSFASAMILRSSFSASGPAFQVVFDAAFRELVTALRAASRVDIDFSDAFVWKLSRTKSLLFPSPAFRPLAIRLRIHRAPSCFRVAYG